MIDEWVTYNRQNPLKKYPKFQDYVEYRKECRQ